MFWLLWNNLMMRKTCLSDCCCSSIKLFSILPILLTIVILLFLSVFGRDLNFTLFFLASLHILEVIYSLLFCKKITFHFFFILFWLNYLFLSLSFNWICSILCIFRWNKYIFARGVLLNEILKLVIRYFRRK